MSSHYMKKVMICKIGKKEDRSDCSKKSCEDCRHWILKEMLVPYSNKED